MYIPLCRNRNTGLRFRVLPPKQQKVCCNNTPSEPFVNRLIPITSPPQ